MSTSFAPTRLAATVLIAAGALAACDRPGNDITSNSTRTDGSATSSAGTAASAPDSTALGSSAPGSTTGSSLNSSTSSGSTGTDANATDTQSSSTGSTSPSSTADSTGSTASTAPFTPAERRFVAEAAGAGLYEVEAGKLAAEKASDPQVKAFGSMLVTHHTAANEELTRLAQAHHMTVPTQIPASKRAEMNRLSKAGAAAFDRQFVRTTGVADHQATIRQFEQASKTVKDPDLKAFIDKTLPTLRDHLQQAQQLARAGASNTTGDAGAAAANPAARPSATP